MSPVAVEFARSAHAADLPLPQYQSAGAAGMDLLAAIPADRPIMLAPGLHVLVPTGIAIKLPPGFEGQVRPRSGLAARHAVTVLNAPGTIDADYRGEIQVILINHGSAAFEISRGMRIAQLLIAPVVQGRWVEVDALTPSQRGPGGFGSTGV